MESNTKQINVKSNTRIGWEYAFGEMTSHELKNKQFIFKIEISGNTSAEQNDITNLKYFFPLMNELEHNKCECSLMLKYLQNNSDFNNFVERLRVFLCDLFQEMYIDYEEKIIMLFSKNYIDNDLKLTGFRKERMFENQFLNPVVSEIIEEYSSNFIKSEQDYEIIENVFKNIIMQKSNVHVNQRVLIVPNPGTFESFLNICNTINQNIHIRQYIKQYNYEFKYILRIKTRVVVSNIFPIIKVEDPEKMDFNNIITCYDKYFDDFNNYKGIHKNKINEEQKKDLFSQLIEKIKEITYLGSELEKIILRFLLRNFIERKEIFNFNENPVQINISILEKLSADARTYAEGLYQIIENACLHSHGKCAFWGMRIHTADRNATMSEYEKESQTRIKLFRKYEHCLQRNSNGQIISNHIFNNNVYSDFIEFYVLDNALNKNGIVPNYNCNELKVNKIREIVELDETNYTEANKNATDYYIIHYGLRWLTKIIEKNNGCFSVLSPFDSANASCYCSNALDEIPAETYIGSMVYSTEYSILLPLSYAWQSIPDEDINIKNNCLFGDKIETDNYEFEKMNIDYENFKKYNTEKVRRIYMLYNRIKNVKKTVLFVLDGSNTVKNIEVFAKALFLHIYNTYIADEKRKLYIAIDFGENRNLIYEFVRIFSIFYDKLNKNNYMVGVQIALASLSKNDNKEINFIIAGENLESAYTIANVFTYYNSESTAPFIPLLKYLAVSNNKLSKKLDNINQFPFDIYICDGRSNWFLERMNCVLNTDIQSKNYGCKISGIHIRISSRLHLDNFYEAELLFHNIGNVYRFAYIIAQDIIKDLNNSVNEKVDIMILGYENYSSILIQQIRYWVDNSISKNCGKVYSAIVSTLENGGSNISYLEDVKTSSGIFCYTVIPVGTTMSTVYKVRNVFLKNFKEKCEFKNNYAIIAVCDKLYKEDRFKGEKVIEKYWRDVDYSKKEINLNPQKSNEPGITVKYYLTANSKWHDADNCNLCTKNIPLIQVDKTSTIPNAIFELIGNNRKFFENKRYKNKIEHFKPELSADMSISSVVTYSHLYRGNNHYQFYFDFEKYVDNTEAMIRNWAKGICIDQQTFNIVISPLNISNSKFLKIVIDNVFASSLRFLHIDITNTYKEDARAKFSYIAQEYATIKRLNSKTEINFYYIDDSIVTGQTINRGRALLKMLIDESGLMLNEFVGFKKIFLLINRSSYDTLNSLLENPSENFHAFFNLYIPSYNTNNNFCPGCSIQRKYELLRKRSASEALSVDFARLAYKHMKRTPEEYNIWLNDAIRHEHSYFAWLKSWLYTYGKENSLNKNISKKANDFILKLRSDILDYVEKELRKEACLTKESKEKFLSNIGTLTINSFLVNQDEKYAKKVMNLMKYIVSERAFLRLKTMNYAYSQLQNITQTLEENSVLKLHQKTKQHILEFLNLKDVEELISYIKVISREQLSNYYHVKVAIVDILINLLNIIIDEETENNMFEKSGIDYIKNDICCALKYQLVITIIHRLAMLQSPTILDCNKVKKLITFFELLYNQYFEEISNMSLNDKYIKLTEIPKKDKIIEKFMKSIKTATMLNNDDALCKRLFDLENSLFEGETGND